MIPVYNLVDDDGNIVYGPVPLRQIAEYLHIKLTSAQKYREMEQRTANGCYIVMTVNANQEMECGWVKNWKAEWDRARKKINKKCRRG